VSLPDLVADADSAELLAAADAVSRLQGVEPRAGAVAHPRDRAYARAWLYERLQ
jgi:hypothetical protein